MNALKQLEDGIIGSPETHLALSTQRRARILLISDSHGRGDIMQRIIEEFGASCSALIFTGDGISDLVACLEKAAKNERFMAALPATIAAVQGNNDAARYSSTVMPPIQIPSHALLRAAGHTIYAVHGHEQFVYYGTSMLERAAANAGADIAVFGHTHYPEDRQGSVYVVNAGSCALPRNLSPQSFAVLNLEEKQAYAVFYKMSGNAPVFTPYIPEALF